MHGMVLLQERHEMQKQRLRIGTPNNTTTPLITYPPLAPTHAPRAPACACRGVCVCVSRRRLFERGVCKPSKARSTLLEEAWVTGFWGAWLGGIETGAAASRP